ncbi:hypothetical protein C8F01DRAFT_1105756 [Mycena amicta]|nr:hypothetical protein C8F01DRAFT_1105756 [Mycena amicta]
MLSSVRGLFGQRLRAVRTPGVSFRHLASAPAQLLDDQENAQSTYDEDTVNAREEPVPTLHGPPLSVIISRLPPFTTRSDLRDLATQIGVADPNQIIGASFRMPIQAVVTTATYISAIFHFSEPHVACEFHRQAKRMLLQVNPGGSPSKPATLRALSPTEARALWMSGQPQHWDTSSASEFRMLELEWARRDSMTPGLPTSDKDNAPSILVFRLMASLTVHPSYTIDRVRTLQEAGATRWITLQVPEAVTHALSKSSPAIFLAIENRLRRDFGSFGVLEGIRIWRSPTARLWFATVGFSEVYDGFKAVRLLPKQRSEYAHAGMNFAKTPDTLLAPGTMWTL